MSGHRTQHWQPRKPVTQSSGGIVASQSAIAARAGAECLATGGNAVDAAVVTGLALNATEPWMSGIGGGGYMVVYLAAELRAEVVGFGMRAAQGLDVADYPIVGGVAGDLFPWPAVKDDRNFIGYKAIAVPGNVAGLSTALDRFGTLDWRDAMRPAIALARQGTVVDWVTTMWITAEARGLRQDGPAAARFMPDGLPPVHGVPNQEPRIRLDALVATLERLAEAGPKDFYEGQLASAIAADLAAGGSAITEGDLSAYQAEVCEPLVADHRGAELFLAPGLTAGPTLADALGRLPDDIVEDGPRPGEKAFPAYARALAASYRDRLATMGDSGDRGESCTSHLSVVDRHGNMVALTQTLLSLFGSRVVLPETGILMNNGIAWFDPEPGKPNSLAPGRQGLSNMTPMIARRADGSMFAAGASGGRKIVSAVTQLASMLIDFGMDLETAMHQARIDVSGTEGVNYNPNLPDQVIAALAGFENAQAVEARVAPNAYANLSVVTRSAQGLNQGLSEVMAPWASAVSEDG